MSTPQRANCQWKSDPLHPTPTPELFLCLKLHTDHLVILELACPGVMCIWIDFQCRYTYLPSPKLTLFILLCSNQKILCMVSVPFSYWILQTLRIY